jgi:hypothetical protein
MMNQSSVKNFFTQTYAKDLKHNKNSINEEEVKKISESYEM